MPAAFFVFTGSAFSRARAAGFFSSRPFVGAADWLCKLDPRFAGYTVWCHDEGKGPEGLPDHWDRSAQGIAVK